MTQEARTTESENRDNAAIREIMHQVRDLTVPDRATLALGIIGNLATMMNSRQMEKLLTQLAEEAVRVQDVPPSRQGGRDATDRGGMADPSVDDRGMQVDSRGAKASEGRGMQASEGRMHASEVRGMQGSEGRGMQASEGRMHASEGRGMQASEGRGREVGQDGRGAVGDPGAAEQPSRLL